MAGDADQQAGTPIYTPRTTTQSGRIERCSYVRRARKRFVPKPVHGPSGVDQSSAG
jgi:hypothetical protein